MKHIINWSGLCEKENVLTNIKNFTTYRYFHFYLGTLNKEKQSNLIVRCRVKVSVYDEWKELDISFLRSVPDLSKTPPTIFDLSSDYWAKKKVEITKRIESEEGRIKQPSKIVELRQLRDSVYRSRKENFHWNLKNSVEWKHKEQRQNENASVNYDSNSNWNEENV